VELFNPLVWLLALAVVLVMVGASKIHWKHHA
jgi:hypothetical protein